MDFPIDLTEFRPLALDPSSPSLAPEALEQLRRNVLVCRDSIIFFTAVAEARGLGGHTGGPYDVVPEAMILDAFVRGSDRIVPIPFDEAGHRVALHYLLSVLKGAMPARQLLRYREAGGRLPGHPERGLTPGVEFSSGRLGHLWPYVNGVAIANPGRAVFLLGSDGSQMEGDDAEAARLAVARRLPVKLLIDDNDVTISGHPREYLPGFDVARTLEGHGLHVDRGEGEDLASLHRRMVSAFLREGPVALVNRRPMAPGVKGIEGSPKGHDVIKVEQAIGYLASRGRTEAVRALEAVAKPKGSVSFRGSSAAFSKNRDLFGELVCERIAALGAEERRARVLVIDSDLEGSCGLHHVRKRFPDLYVAGGVMERGNFSAAAGFGREPGRQGIFGTFSAFLEMVISEITMARLNDSNVLAHFSHAGVDDMADNTCHFGVNNFFADNGLAAGDRTRLYFPADRHQMKALLERVFDDGGLRFVFSTRSGTPEILGLDGKPLYGGDYRFEPGRDEVVRPGRRGYVVSYGEMLYRCLDAVEGLRAEGIDVGLVNKPTLNVPDEAALATVGRSPFALVVETQNRSTGLGVRYGTWLLERGFAPRYAHLGVTRPGEGGLSEQVAQQGLDPAAIAAAVRGLLR